MVTGCAQHGHGMCTGLCRAFYKIHQKIVKIVVGQKKIAGHYCTESSIKYIKDVLLKTILLFLMKI